jgi:hypothetical protein
MNPSSTLPPSGYTLDLSLVGGTHQGALYLYFILRLGWHYVHHDQQQIVMMTTARLFGSSTFMLYHTPKYIYITRSVKEIVYQHIKYNTYLSATMI